MKALHNFNEYGSVLAFSIEDPKGQETVKQDFVIAGSPELLGRGLGIMMHRHPDLLLAMEFAIQMYGSLVTDNPDQTG